MALLLLILDYQNKSEMTLRRGFAIYKKIRKSGEYLSKPSIATAGLHTHTQCMPNDEIYSTCVLILGWKLSRQRKFCPG